MSTSEVLRLCLVIIGICELFIQAYKKKYPPGLPKPAVTSFEVIIVGG